MPELHGEDELSLGATRLNRYWDPHLSRRTVKLRPGEYCVSSTDEMLVTVVASSLAVCVRDRVKRILGMSHFMLPTIGLSRLDQHGLELAKTCGHAALAKLLHDIYSYGCEEDSLEAVLVTGGEMWPKKKQSTVDSLDFAREYLSAHGVEIIGHSNLAASVPADASMLYSRNVLTLMKLLIAESAINLDLEDEIVAGALLTHEGVCRHERTAAALEGGN